MHSVAELFAIVARMRAHARNLVLVLGFAPLGLACWSPLPAKPADRIFVGGPIIQVDAAGHVAEALAVRAGLVQAVGREAAIMALRGPDTQVTELQGRAVLPGFIDAHGHITQVAALAAGANLAPPPVGSIRSIPDLQAKLREHIAHNEAPAGQWVLGVGFDDSLLAEQRMPTRDDLDAVSSEHPILIIHISLHLGVANSAALAAAGIGPDTEDPPGGVFRRRAGGRVPNGVLEEHALYAIFGALPSPDLETRLVLLDAAQQSYMERGFTTAQDGATGPADWELLRAAADRGRLRIDVSAYPVWLSADEIFASGTPVGVYQDRLELGGVKLVLDGSPQGKTAWLSEPYYVVPEGQEPDYRGYPALQDEAVDRFVADFYARDWPLLAHTNGDAASDQLIRAVEKAVAAHGQGDRRTIVIHAQTVRDDQLDRIKTLGMSPSFFTSHTFFWGDWHRDSVLGPERAARISPAATARAKGVRFSFHNDAPVTPPDVMQLLWSGVNRLTRSDQVLGPDERVSPMTAIRAVTIDAAWQSFDEDRKGSIEPGKLADLVVLSASPLDVEPKELRGIAVVETIKEGLTVYP